MSGAREVNFDGLIGPNHNYGGLSEGNLASAQNKNLVSQPKIAALQGLEKMQRLMRAGLTQAVLPPPLRPNLALLEQGGLPRNGVDAISISAKRNPQLLKAAYSASSMWAANAATISPSADASDGRLHLTPANLSTMLHRSIEHPETTRLLRAIFGDENHFSVHSALPGHSSYADEGAANHVRLSKSHGSSGVELFVYGREGDLADTAFPARQSRLASETIIASHKLDPARIVLAQQARTAIEAGAFHNDVVCVGSLNTLFFHEYAFENTDKTLADIRKAVSDLFELEAVMVRASDVSLSDAISSYLFNSQLLDWPGEDGLVLFAPTEVRDTPSTAAYCEKLAASNGPIGRVEFVDVRQSMRNGGGPACLRLRVVMTDAEIAAAHPGVFLDDAKIEALQAVIHEHYRETLSPEELADPAFANECKLARRALLSVLDLEHLA